MAKKEVLDPIYHAVIATDAGCRPNPGFMGCGAFGYLYDNNDLGKKNW
jgi:ribonuclease HI